MRGMAFGGASSCSIQILSQFSLSAILDSFPSLTVTTQVRTQVNDQADGPSQTSPGPIQSIEQMALTNQLQTVWCERDVLHT